MLAHDSPETLHYVDPPYVLGTRNGGTDYRHELTDEQHRHLAAVLNELAGMVIVSGYPCELYEELFAGWTRIQKRAFADGARERTEVLWLRNIESEETLWTTKGSSGANTALDFCRQ